MANFIKLDSLFMSVQLSYCNVSCLKILILLSATNLISSKHYELKIKGDFLLHFKANPPRVYQKCWHSNDAISKVYFITLLGNVRTGFSFLEGKSFILLERFCAFIMLLNKKA